MMFHPTGASSTKSKSFLKKASFSASIFLLALPAALAQESSGNTIPCPSASVIGDQEIALGESFSLSFVGFKNPTIKYTSAQPEVDSALLTIVAASEDATIDISGDLVTIAASESCSNTESSGAPSPSGSYSPTSAPSRSTSSALSAVMALPFLFKGGIMQSSASFLLVSLFAGTFVGVSAEQVCEPSIEVEIQLPYQCPYNNFVNGMCFTPKEIADLAVQALFVDFDVAAAGSLLAEDYIQHNPTVPTGAAPVLNFIPFLQESGLEIETHRTIAENNLVAYHSTYTNATLFGADILVGFDVFRVEEGRVQEHWDNLQPLAGPNPNGNTMVDGPTMIKYRGETQENKDLATGLVQAVLVEGNASAATDFISTQEYTQHNPGIADGLDGLGAALVFLAEQGLSFTYDSIELVVAEGNFVMLGSPGEFGEGSPTAYYDLFRLEGGLIVEHWDVIQSIPPPEDFQHENGKF